MDEVQNYSNRPNNRFRNYVIEQLKASYAHDIIDEKDFEERLNIATNAQNKHELLALLSDLPEISELEKNQKQPDTPGDYTLNTGRVKENNSFFNIFSGVTKKGAWKPARHIDDVSIFGGSTLDFRGAELPPEGVNIEVIDIFGGTEIIVPPGVNVDVNGFAIFGGFEDKTSDEEYPGAPTIRVSGIAIFGGTEVKQKPLKRSKKK